VEDWPNGGSARAISSRRRGRLVRRRTQRLRRQSRPGHPRGYPAYARILHPARDDSGDEVRWSDVATSSSTVLHPLAQFHAIAGRWEYDRREQVGWPGENPNDGSLNPAAASRVVRDPCSPYGYTESVLAHSVGRLGQPAAGVGAHGTSCARTSPCLLHLPASARRRSRVLLRGRPDRLGPRPAASVHGATW
jgi:hypothetical protein